MSDNLWSEFFMARRPGKDEDGRQVNLYYVWYGGENGKLLGAFKSEREANAAYKEEYKRKNPQYAKYVR